MTHEEFTAANEEVLAMNEELQSTNEELETSKEELQSLNEELVTVNSQLNEKVEDLSTANDDLANFLNSSEVATLFLDRGFCIRRFTASATRLMNSTEFGCRPSDPSYRQSTYRRESHGGRRRRARESGAL